ncbi:MAG: hypothetical protein HYT79_01370 [Elusimicrobia bacterium]|nr:hypothetical protein [Elusimicrobiota bacterium]
MRILILRLSSLGDVALLSPVFEDIKRAYPEARITCLVKSAYAGILQSNPNVDKVVIFKDFWTTLAELRQHSWDAVLDLHAVLRTRLLTAALGARWKITYGKNVLERWRMVLLGHRLNTNHTLERYQKALRSLGIGLKRVVVMQTALMGDVVLTIPMLRSLRERLNPEELAVVVKPEYASLFLREGFSLIEDDKWSKDRGLSGFLRILKILRRGRFDLVLAPQRSLRSALLAWFSGIPLRAGFRSSTGFFLWNRLAPFDWKEHDTSRNLRLLDAVPLPRQASGRLSNPGEFRIRLREEDERRALEIWQDWGVDPRQEFLIGLTPGASRLTKRWLTERFGQLGARLKEEMPGSRLVLIGGPQDQMICEQVAVASGGALNLAGRVNIGDLPGVIRLLKLFVTNDSGPMHLAWGSGVPTVAVFGPTVRGFGFFPLGPASRVVEVEDLACRPCGLHGGKTCPQGHFLCMGLITVDQVLASCREVLNKKTETPVAVI